MHNLAPAFEDERHLWCLAGARALSRLGHSLVVMWGRTYSRRRRAHDVRRAAERAEHARQEESVTRG
jgi:hypothetical protein